DPWTLTGKLLNRVETDETGAEWLPVGKVVQRAFEAEKERRRRSLTVIERLRTADPGLAHHPVLDRWERELRPFSATTFREGDRLPVRRVAADPAHVNE